MISLRLFVFILVTLACRACGNTSHTHDWHVTCLATAGMTLGCGLLFKMSALALLIGGGDAASADSLRRRCAQARVLVESLWMLVLPMTLLATGWGAGLQMYENSGGWLSLSLGGWFLPSTALLLLLEMTAAQFDDIVDERNVTAGNAGCATASWLYQFRDRLQYGDTPQAAVCLAPVMALCVAQDVVVAAGYPQPSGAWLVGLSAAGLCLFMLVAPGWLGWWVGARAIRGGILHDRFEAYRRRAGLKQLQLRIVSSGGRWQGAAAVGWLPGFRQVWLGDGLIGLLDDRELDMVLLHEMAHVIRGHFLWRLMPVGCVAAGLGIWFGLHPSGESLESGLGIAELTSVDPRLATVVPLLGLVAGLSLVSRRCELDADRCACGLAEACCVWAGDQPGEAPRALGRALTKLLGETPELRRASWLHPSLAQRLQNLIGDGRDHATAEAPERHA